MTSKRSNGNGSIDRLKSGNWRARITNPKDPKKRITVGVFRLKSEAEKALRSELGRIDDGSWTPPEHGTLTVSEYANNWLTSKIHDWQQSTMDTNAEIVRLYINRRIGNPTGKGSICLGDMLIVSIDPTTTKLWRAAVHSDIRARAQSRQSKPLRDHYGDGRTAVVWRVARAMFNEAVADEILSSNPFKLRAGGVNKNPTVRVAVPYEALPDLADAMPPRYGAAVWIAATAGGAREGEVTALRRKDIEITRDRGGDIVGGWVHIQRSAYWPREKGTKEPIYKAPKSAAGNRSVPMPATVARIVAGHLAFFVGEEPDALLFTGVRTGGPMRNDVLSDAFERAAKKIGHPEYLFHGLRHGYASALSGAGVPLRDIQAAGGWSSLAMVNHYAKPLPDAMDRIVKAQAEVFGL